MDKTLKTQQMRIFSELLFVSQYHTKERVTEMTSYHFSSQTQTTNVKLTVYKIYICQNDVSRGGH